MAYDPERLKEQWKICDSKSLRFKIAKLVLATVWYRRGKAGFLKYLQTGGMAIVTAKVGLTRRQLKQLLGYANWLYRKSHSRRALKSRAGGMGDHLWALRCDIGYRLRGYQPGEVPLRTITNAVFNFDVPEAR